MTLSDWASVALLAAGAFFFVAGTIGLLRLPDVFTRLHALTKADNLGLGLILLGLALQAESWGELARLGLIWALAVFASASACHLVARRALESGAQPWSKRDAD